nr:retrovirus-related Pol polyprotein from transposon TNT 1-94 [Tanacetum cinerariifolium]
MMSEFIAKVPSASALQVLRRLGSIFTSMYATVQKLKKALGFIQQNHDTGRILLSGSPRNTTDSLVAVTDSSTTNYNSTDEILVCSIPLPPLKKLDGAEPLSGPKTLKSILRSKSTFKAEALKDVTINELSSTPTKGNKSSLASKVHSAPAGKLKSVKIEDDPPLAIVMKELNNLKLQFSKNQIISLERKINPRNPQHAFKKCKACGSPNHTTADHYDIEWFKREDTSIHNTIPIPIPPLPIPSMVTPAPQDRWSKDKHIEILNIIGNLGAGMLTRAMAKELSAALAHESYQMDVKSAFLNGKLKEEVYVKQPLDFESSTFPNHVCKLDKVLYGLKQAPRACENSNGTPNNLGPDLNRKAVNETQYKANTKESHLTAVKRSFRYIKGTPSLGLRYPKCSGFDLKGYSYSDYVGCNMDKKSTSGACQFLRGKLVCWSAKKQQSVAMSSAKVEYVPIFCDNTNAIAISNNPVLYSRTKHIDIRHHFIRDHVLKGDIDLHFITTQYQFADIFTKPLEESTFKRLIVELGRVRGEIGITTFRNALKAHYLPHSTMYVPLPSITTMDYAKIIWYDLIHKLNKKTKEKSIPFPRFLSLLLEHMSPKYENKELTINPTQVFSVHNLTLKPKPKERPFTDHMKAICNLVVPVDSKAPKPSSHTKKAPQGKKPGATTGLRSKRSSKHTSGSKTEASKSQTGQSKIETQSSSAKEKSLSRPSHPTPMVGKMHKDAQQAAGGLTSLGATRHDVSADSIAEANHGPSTPNGSIPPQQGMDEGTKSTSYDHIFTGSNPNVLVDKTKSVGDGLKTVRTESGASKELGADEISKKIKLKDLENLLKDTRSTFFTPDSPPDEPINVSDEIPHPPSPILAQIHELMAQLTTLLVTFLKPELAKLFASHDLATCLPSELKELPSKVTKLSKEIKELKQHDKDMKLELHGDLKEIPSKVETFTSTISSLLSHIAKLKNIQWELPAEIPDLPHLISLIQETLKTLDSLLGLLNKVTNTLNRFATMVENALKATTVNVLLAGKAIASPANGGWKNTKDADTNLKNEQVNLLGIDVVTQYYNKKVLYERYYEKIKKRRQSSKIINCDVLAKKGPISLKIYKEDGTAEVIGNFKASDLHLAE